MSRIWTIAKREFKSYFKSPIGWVLFAIYALVSGFYYSLLLSYNYVDTSAVLNFMRGLFMVLIPIMTMRTFSSEKLNGTEILYQTSPASTLQVVIGKYLGVSLMFLLISSVNLIYVMITLSFNGLVDFKYWGTLIAYLLTGLAYIAIGLFASSLTTSQVIAAIISFVIFVGFEVFTSISKIIGSGISSIINFLDFPDAIPAASEANIGKAVTSGLDWLNPATKLAGFAKGTFDLVSVVYFISMIILFLYVTAQINESSRWKQ